MRTGRSLTVLCRSLLPGGEGVCSGGCLLLGVSGPRGVFFGGPAPRGGWYSSMHWGRPHPLWTESQTPVKTLPWPNFVAAGKNSRILGGSLVLKQFPLPLILMMCVRTWVQKMRTTRGCEINVLQRYSPSSRIVCERSLTIPFQLTSTRSNYLSTVQYSTGAHSSICSPAAQFHGRRQQVE